MTFNKSHAGNFLIISGLEEIFWTILEPWAILEPFWAILEPFCESADVGMSSLILHGEREQEMTERREHHSDTDTDSSLLDINCDGCGGRRNDGTVEEEEEEEEEEEG